MTSRSDTVTLWRCRACGQWSHARRRPTTHVRAEPLLDGLEAVGLRKVRCGPFVRWTATPDAADADRPAPSSVGQVVREIEWEDDPNDGLAEEYSRSIIDGLNQQSYDLYADDAAVPF